VDAVKSSGFKGEEVDEIASVLEPHVVKVHAERVKELLFLHGKRSKKKPK